MPKKCFVAVLCDFMFCYKQQTYHYLEILLPKNRGKRKRERGREREREREEEEGGRLEVGNIVIGQFSKKIPLLNKDEHFCRLT